MNSVSSEANRSGEKCGGGRFSGDLIMEIAIDHSTCNP
jgi:hypothetical protein